LTVTDRHVHFLHVGKTGGSTIKAALAGIPHRVTCHGHHVRLCDIPPDDDVFFFVRDPIGRFVSAFNSRLRSGRPRYDIAWNDGERRAFTRFGTPTALAEALTSPDADVAAAAYDAMREIRHVNAHFTKWFSEAEIVARRERIVLLGLQAFLSSDFAFLKRKLALPDAIALPADDVTAHRTPSGYETLLSPLGSANIAAWYAQDLAFYDHYQTLRADWYGLPAESP
jgi:hypothetical protein